MKDNPNEFSSGNKFSFSRIPTSNEKAPFAQELVFKDSQKEKEFSNRFSNPASNQQPFSLHREKPKANDRQLQSSQSNEKPRNKNRHKHQNSPSHSHSSSSSLSSTVGSGVEEQQDNYAMGCKVFWIGLLAFGIGFVLIYGAMETFDSSASFSFTQLRARCSADIYAVNLMRIQKLQIYEDLIIVLVSFAFVIGLVLFVYLILVVCGYWRAFVRWFNKWVQKVERCCVCCRCFQDINSGKGQAKVGPRKRRMAAENSLQLQEFESQLKHKVISNILNPTHNQSLNSSSTNRPLNLKGNQSKYHRTQNNSPFQKQPKTSKNKYTRIPRQPLQPTPQVKQLIDKWQAIQDYQCDDCSECMQFMCVCVCCRTCCQAHRYTFYESKNEEYWYWGFYLFKTVLLGMGVGYLGRLYDCLNELKGCASGLIDGYFGDMETLYVIGIGVVILDVLGYWQVMAEGTCWDGIMGRGWGKNYEGKRQGLEHQKGFMKNGFCWVRPEQEAYWEGRTERRMSDSSSSSSNSVSSSSMHTQEKKKEEKLKRSKVLTKSITTSSSGNNQSVTESIKAIRNRLIDSLSGIKREPEKEERGEIEFNNRMRGDRMKSTAMPKFQSQQYRSNQRKDAILIRESDSRDEDQQQEPHSQYMINLKIPELPKEESDSGQFEHQPISNNHLRGAELKPYSTDQQPNILKSQTFVGTGATFRRRF